MKQISTPNCCCAFLLITWLLSTATALPQDKPAPPKYGPTFIRLYHAREHIQRQPAPDFWALMPYYVGQPDDSTCSTATVAMIFNALRADQPLKADDKLITQKELLDKVPARLWKDKVAPGGKGVTLDELGKLLPLIAKAYKMPPTQIEVIHFSEKSDALQTRLRRLLMENERSSDDFIIVNFLQSGLSGDPNGAVGHFAPVAAYDAKKDRVLILDPDRTWYEPYWVPVEKLLAAMATRDVDAGRNRGLIRVSVRRE